MKKKRAIRDNASKTRKLSQRVRKLRARLDEQAARQKRLHRRVKGLRSGLKALGEGQEQVQGAVMALDGALERMHEGPSPQEPEPGPVTEALAALREHSQGLDARIDELDSALIGAERQLGELRTQAESTTGWAEQVDERLAHLDGLGAQLQAASGALHERIAALEATSQDLDQRAQRLDARESGLEQRLQTLGAAPPAQAEAPPPAGLQAPQGPGHSLEQAARRLDALSQRLEQDLEHAAARVEALEQSQAGLDRRAGELSGALEGMQGRAEALAGDQQALHEAVGELRARVQALQDSVSALQRSSAELSRDQQSLATRAESLEQGLGAAQDRTQASAEKLARLEGEMAGVASRDGERETRLAARDRELTEHAASLEQKLGALGQRLEAQEARQRGVQERSDSALRLTRTLGLAGLLVVLAGLGAGYLVHRALDGRLAGLDARVQAHSRSAAHAPGVEPQRVAAAESRLKSLELHLQSMDQRLGAGAEAGARREQALQRSQARLGTLSAGMAGLRDAVTDLELRLDSLESAQALPAMPEWVHSARWVAGLSGQRYVIQIAAAHRRENLITLLERSPPPGPVAGYRRRSAEQTWYVLVQGSYPSRAQALQALRRLPAPWSGFGPWVRRAASVQSELGPAASR